jgi:hypothetical protein
MESVLELVLVLRSVSGLGMELELVSGLEWVLVSVLACASREALGLELLLWPGD